MRSDCSPRQGSAAKLERKFPGRASLLATRRRINSTKKSHMATSRAPKKAAAKPISPRPIKKSELYVSDIADNATVGGIARSSGNQIMMAFERDVVVPGDVAYDVQRTAVATVTMDEDRAREFLKALATTLGDQASNA